MPQNYVYLFSMAHTLYFIPGVATDARVFAALELPGYDKVFLEWKKPWPNESMAQYAERFAAQIDPDSQAMAVGTPLLLFA
jgi:hypothetical protein